MTALDIRCGIKHLLHAWASLRSLVGDDHAVACVHLATENALAGVFLRVEAHGRSLKMPKLRSHAGRLHHATVLGDVSKQHGQSAILGIRVLQVANATVLPVGVGLSHWASWLPITVENFLPGAEW